MKTKSYSSIKYILLLGVLLALSTLTACTLPFKIVANSQPEKAPPEEGFMPSGDEEAGRNEVPEGEGGERIVEFRAERPNLAPGECTMLWWQVEDSENVSLNGQLVEPMGEQELCLEESKSFVLSAGSARSEINVVVDGMSAEEPPQGEGPPQVEEPPQGEEPQNPPPASGMNDEEVIKQALLAELGWNESELEFSIGRQEGNFAEGGVKKAGDMSGAQWLAAKDNGHWIIVHSGQDLPTCNAIQPYNFPSDWVAYCWDEASGTSVQR